MQNKFLWKGLNWKTGKLIAIGRNGGKDVARHELMSPGKAVRLHLEVENPDDWKADGMDLQYIRVTAVDSKGIPVENYNGQLSIDLTGEAKLLALDNGDHFTERNLEENTAPLYRGSALLILRSTQTPGEVNVKFSVPGIKTAKLKVATK